MSSLQNAIVVVVVVVVVVLVILGVDEPALCSKLLAN
jgi:preprotein translocase subunit SecE